MIVLGYVEKKNPRNGAYNHRRFLVLTKESIHWFNRPDGHNLFGDERGKIVLSDVLFVHILDEDSTTFEIKDAVRNTSKYFRCNSPTETEEWVSGIRSAIKRLPGADNKGRKGLARRTSIANILLPIEDTDTEVGEGQTKVEVDVLLVSLRSMTNSNLSLSGRINNTSITKAIR